MAGQQRKGLAYLDALRDVEHTMAVGSAAAVAESVRQRFHGPGNRLILTPLACDPGNLARARPIGTLLWEAAMRAPASAAEGLLAAGVPTEMPVEGQGFFSAAREAVAQVRPEVLATVLRAGARAMDDASDGPILAQLCALWPKESLPDGVATLLDAGASAIQRSRAGMAASDVAQARGCGTLAHELGRAMKQQRALHRAVKAVGDGDLAALESALDAFGGRWDQMMPARGQGGRAAPAADHLWRAFTPLRMEQNIVILPVVLDRGVPMAVRGRLDGYVHLALRSFIPLAGASSPAAQRWERLCREVLRRTPAPAPAHGDDVLSRLVAVREVDERTLIEHWWPHLEAHGVHAGTTLRSRSTLERRTVSIEQGLRAAGRPASADWFAARARVARLGASVAPKGAGAPPAGASGPAL